MYNFMYVKSNTLYQIDNRPLVFAYSFEENDWRKRAESADAPVNKI